MNPWICPRCERVNSPYTPYCCRPQVANTFNSTLGIYLTKNEQEAWGRRHEFNVSKSDNSKED